MGNIFVLLGLLGILAVFIAFFFALNPFIGVLGVLFAISKML